MRPSYINNCPKVKHQLSIFISCITQQMNQQLYKKHLYNHEKYEWCCVPQLKVLHPSMKSEVSITLTNVTYVQPVTEQYKLRTI